MSWLFGNYQNFRTKKLNEIVVPATHDSGMYKIMPYIDVKSQNTLFNIIRKFYLIPYVKFVVDKWVKTQNKSIYNQLKMGIRALDIRISYAKNDFYVTHILAGISFDKLMLEINQFFREDENKNEYIIFEIRPDYDNKNNINRKRDVINKLWEKIDSNSEFKNRIYTGNDIPIYELMVEQNKNLFFIVDNELLFTDNILANNLMSRSRIDYKWPNTVNVNKMIEINTTHLNRPHNDTRFKQILLTITAKTDTIIHDVKCFALKNIVFILLPLTIILLWLLNKTTFNNTTTSNLYKIIIVALVLIMLIIIVVYYRNFKCHLRFSSVKSKVAEILNKSYENLFTNPNIKDISIITTDFPDKEFIDKVKQLNNIL